MNGIELKASFASGRPVYGTLIVSTQPNWISRIADTGLDFVFLDLEHKSIDRVTLEWMCRSCRAAGLAPIVRIPRADPFQACQVLDAGATGILTAYTESPEEIRALRGAVKLRPLKGERLHGYIDGREELEPALSSYLQEGNQGNVLIANIESRPAMDRLDEILSEPGLDGAIIGPHDLSCSLGVPEDYRSPVFDEAVRTIIRKCREKKIGIGIHYSYGMDQEISWAKEGANIILHNSDIGLFMEGIKRDIDTFRRELSGE